MRGTLLCPRFKILIRIMGTCKASFAERQFALIGVMVCKKGIQFFVSLVNEAW